MPRGIDDFETEYAGPMISSADIYVEPDSYSNPTVYAATFRPSILQSSVGLSKFKGVFHPGLLGLPTRSSYDYTKLAR